MSWYKVTLTGDMARRHCWGFPQEVAEYHLKIMHDDNVPFPGIEAVVFKLNDPPQGTCTYYFSPNAAAAFKELVDYYGGEACFKPLASEVSVSVGDKDAAKKLLSD
jgi:hypothetical protein